METPQTSPDKDLIPQINYSRGQYADEFSGERAKLVQQAFSNYKIVTIEEQLSGYSGAQTWRVATDTGEVFVIKIAHASTIEREYENYRTYKVNRLRNAARQEDKPFVSENGEWALLKSTFARIRQSQTLLEYLSKKQGADSNRILQDIFRGTDDHWWQTDQKERINWGVHYDRLLPEHLRVEAFDGNDPSAEILKAGEVAQDRIAELEQRVTEEHYRPNLYLQDFRVEKVKGDVLTICADPPANVKSPTIRIKVTNAPHAVPGTTISVFAKNLQTRRELLSVYARQAVPTFIPDSEEFDSEYIKYPNPIPYLQELLDITDETKFSIIHGDLNLQNVLIELGTDNNKRYRDNWLIDFAETGKGPVLLDLQWLEVQVITWILAPAMQGARENINTLQDVFVALAELTDWPSHLSPALRTPYKVLLEIRRLVDTEYLTIKDDWSEYYRGLVIALLGSLRFEQLSDFSRKVAFLSAATLIRHTEVLPSHLKDLPKPLIIGPRSSEPPIVDINSVPAQIKLQQPIVLRGGASPATSLQVRANQIVIANVVSNDKGIWETELAFDRVGLYQITVHDPDANLQSEPMQIEVLHAPTISDSNLPPQLLPSDSLQLRGTGRPNSPLQILANDRPIAQTICNQAGRWQVDIVLEDAGTYELRVQDEESGIESDALAVIVLVQPRIHQHNLPKQISPNTSFMVEGTGLPNAAIKLLANQQVLTTTQINHLGKWHGEITLSTPGRYQLAALDEEGGLQSSAVTVDVRKKSGSPIWMPLLIGVLLIGILYLGIDTLRPDLVEQASATIGRPVDHWIRSFFGKLLTVPTPISPEIPNVAAAQAYLTEQGEVVVAASVESGPYVYTDSDSQFQGFEAELVREFARRWFTLEEGADPEDAGVLRFAGVKVAERAEKVLEPENDLLIGSVTYLESRCRGERICSKGYSTDPQALVVNAESPVSGYCDTSLDTPQTVFIVLAGTTGDTTFAGYKQQCGFTQLLEENIQYVQTRQNALDEILNDDGRIKVYKSNFALLQFAVEEHQQADQFKVISGAAISQNEPYGMWLNGQYAGLRDLIDETLTEMQRDGTFAELCTQFAGTLVGNNCNFSFDVPPSAAAPIVEGNGACNTAAPTVKIGIAINGSKQYSIFAQDQILGYTIAEEYFNEHGGIHGRCIEPIFVDLQSMTEEANKGALIAAFESLIQDNVVAIVGPGLSQQVVLLDEWLQSVQTPIIGPSTTKWGLVCEKDYFLRVSAPGVWYVGATVDQAGKQAGPGKPNVAIAYAEDDAFTQAEGMAFADYINNNEKVYQPPQSFVYRVNSVDWDANVKIVARDILSTTANLVIIAGLTDDGSLLVQELRNGGYTGPIVGGNGLNTPFIFDTCGEGCNMFDNFYVPQAFSSTTNNDATRNLLDAYNTNQSLVKPNYDSLPGQFMGQMFTAVQVIVEALRIIDEQGRVEEQAWTDTEPLRLRQELKVQLLDREMQFQSTPLGHIAFTPDGEIIQKEFYVTQSEKNENGIGYHFKTIRAIPANTENHQPLAECTVP